MRLSLATMGLACCLAAACASPSSVPDDGGPWVVGEVEHEAPPYVRRLVPTRARFPWNGYRTGSALVPLDAPVRDHPLRPRFAWDRVWAATRYELEVDDSCDRSAYRACDFPSPEAALVTTERDVNLEDPLPVSTEPPVGRRYYWHVRACDEETCTAWTEVRYLDVGRAQTDYDGDGYPDLAVYFRRTPRSYDGGPGFRRVQVWRGGPSGLDPARVISLEREGQDLRPAFVGPLGDLNGDGFDDLFVLGDRIAPDGTLTFEPAILWPGSAEGPRDPVPIPWPNADAEDERLDEEDWSAIPELWARGIGDLDADGFDDAHLLVGGRVLYGSPSGPAEVHGAFPLAWHRLSRVEPLDWNGDGYLDLAGFHLVEDVGTVILWRHGAPGLRERAPITATVAADACCMHAPLWRIDDMDRDGFPELAFLDDRELHVLRGGRDFPATYEGPPFGRFDGAWAYGLLVPSGDVDGDGFADASLRQNVRLPMTVAILSGNADGAPVIAGECSLVTPTYARFVWPSPLFDYDADGYADQVWLAELSDDRDEVDDWGLFSFRGGPDGLPASPPTEVHRFVPAPGLSAVMGGLGSDAWR